MSYRLSLTSEQIDIALQIAHALAANAGIPVADGNGALSFQQLESSLTNNGSRVPSSAAVSAAIAAALSLSQKAQIKGSVTERDDLPEVAEYGDIYIITSSNDGIMWTDSGWSPCGKIMFSGISTINGMSPDPNGEIIITADNINMLSGRSLEEVITDKQDTLFAGDGILIQGNSVSAIALPCNHNLLDNANFGDPVNQRGVSGTITTPGYFFDRWKLESGSVTIGNGYIVLDGTISQPFAYNPQYPYNSPTVATVLTDNGVDDVIPEYSVNNGNRKFTISASGKKIYCAKLEIGHAQTLAHQSDGKWYPNGTRKYVEELMQCKRFLTTMNNNFYGMTGLGYAIDANTIWGYFPVQFKMWGKPTLSDDAGNNWYIRGGGKGYTPSKAEYHGKRDNCIVLKFTVSEAVLNTAFVITCVTQKIICLSCEP